jgi:FtsZ-interacting cell division protein YlmF
VALPSVDQTVQPMTIQNSVTINREELYSLSHPSLIILPKPVEPTPVAIEKYKQSTKSAQQPQSKKPNQNALRAKPKIPKTKNKKRINNQLYSILVVMKNHLIACHEKIEIVIKRPNNMETERNKVKKCDTMCCFWDVFFLVSFQVTNLLLRYVYWPFLY